MRVAERHAVAVGELAGFRGGTRPRRPRTRTASRESASLPRRRRRARRCRTAAASARAKCSAARMPAITPNGPSYLPASITVSICEPISRRLARAARRPRTVPSASSRDRETGLAHPARHQIGRAAVLGREKQPHQPVRLGRDRAERIDHRLGARAERIDVVLGEGRSGSCVRDSAQLRITRMRAGLTALRAASWPPRNRACRRAIAARSPRP